MGDAKKRTRPKIKSNVNRNLEQRAIPLVFKTVFGLEWPWKRKKMGRMPHDSRVVVACIVLMVLFTKTYDSIESYLKQNNLVKSEIKRYLGWKYWKKFRTPGHSVIYRGLQKLTPGYIRELNRKLTINFRRKGMTIIVDSSGFSLRNSSKYFDIRIGRKNSRKECDKLHILVCADSGIIPEFRITDWKKGDSPQFRKMVSKLKEILRAIGDAAYLARKNCTAVAQKKGQAIFWIKKGITAKSKNSPEWKRMVNFFKKHPELYEEIYHIRSFVEAVFSSIKKRWNSFLRSIKKRMQRKELALKVIAYNIKQVLYNFRAQELGISLWEECQ